MTSFIAKTFGVISHQAETVVAVLATSRTLMNSSIVPVVLSDDSLWQRLCTKSFSSPHFRPREGREHCSSELQENILRLFVNFCDTIQFTERLTFLDKINPRFVNSMIDTLIKTKRYFCRTLQHIDFVDEEDIDTRIFGNLGNLRSCNFRFPDFRSTCTVAHLNALCDSTKFPRLQQFGQGLFDVTDEDFQVLANAASLETLDLSGLNVASLGFLKGLKRLKELDLRCCLELTVESFTDLKRLADANSRALLPNLEIIDLKDNEFEMTSSILQLWLDHAPVLRVLKCDAPTTFEGVEIISEMRFLIRLKLIGCNSLDEKCFEVLFSNLAHLEIVQFSGIDLLNDACLLHLSQTRSPIKELSLLFWRTITDKGLGYLTSLKYLEVLNFRGDSQIDNNDLTGEIGEKTFPKSLTELRLYSCTYFTDAGLASTLKSLSVLRELCLYPVPDKVTSEGLKIALAGSHCQNTLEVLYLVSKDNNGTHNLRFVKGLKALKKLDFSGEIDFSVMRGDSDEKGFGALSSCSCLIRLRLRSTGIKDTDIVNELPPNLFETLEEFEVQSNNLTDFALISGISKMKNLRELDIGANVRREDEEENPNPYTIAGVLYAVQHLPHLRCLRVDSEMEEDIRKDTGLVGKKVGPLFGNYVE